MKMEKRESEAIIRILRKVTKIVKLYPFFYAALYLICMAVYYMADETLSDIVDRLFAVTPVAVLPFLSLSRTLKLCKWHRFQCILMATPVIPVLKSLFYEFSFALALASITFAVFVFLLSLINAYFVFIKPKRK